MNLIAIGAGDAVTWNDLLFILVGIAVVLIIIFLVRRT